MAFPFAHLARKNSHYPQSTRLYWTLKAYKTSFNTWCVVKYHNTSEGECHLPGLPHARNREELETTPLPVQRPCDDLSPTLPAYPPMDSPATIAPLSRSPQHFVNTWRYNGRPVQSTGGLVHNARFCWKPHETDNRYSWSDQSYRPPQKLQESRVYSRPFASLPSNDDDYPTSNISYTSTTFAFAISSTLPFSHDL